MCASGIGRTGPPPPPPQGALHSFWPPALVVRGVGVVRALRRGPRPALPSPRDVDKRAAAADLPTLPMYVPSYVVCVCVHTYGYRPRPRTLASRASHLATSTHAHPRHTHTPACRSHARTHARTHRVLVLRSLRLVASLGVAWESNAIKLNLIEVHTCIPPTVCARIFCRKENEEEYLFSLSFINHA